MATYSHRGVSFEVWNDQQSWFWMVRDSRGNRGAIGAAPSETEALREAGFSIEADAPPARLTGMNAWTCAFENFARYLACLNRIAAQMQNP